MHSPRHEGDVDGVAVVEAPAGSRDDDRAPDATSEAEQVGVDPRATPDHRRRGPAPTTRELLAEVGSREPTSPRPAALEQGERRFVRWLIAATALTLLVLGGALWWLDPISVTGRQTRFSVVENGGVRQAKLDLMEELDAPPDVLVLGSSRSMKLDPEEIERVSGAPAFNGGVSGGTTQDVYLYARYADELWGRDGSTAEGEFPHLVIGVVNDVFRDAGTAALDPRLKQYLPTAEQEEDSLLDVAEALLQTKTLEAGARAVRRVVPRDGVGALLDPTEQVPVTADLATTGGQKGNQRQNLSDRGMQLFRPGADYSTPLAARVEVQMADYVRRTYVNDPDYAGAEARGVELLRDTIRLANRNGDQPTLWITPYQPGGVRFLPAAEYAERNREFLAALDALERDPELRFTLVDFADISAFGGDPQAFYDGIHMTEANTARVAAALHERDLLAPR